VELEKFQNLLIREFLLIRLPFYGLIPSGLGTRKFNYIKEGEEAVS